MNNTEKFLNQLDKRNLSDEDYLAELNNYVGMDVTPYLELHVRKEAPNYLETIIWDLIDELKEEGIWKEKDDEELYYGNYGAKFPLDFVLNNSKFNLKFFEVLSYFEGYEGGIGVFPDDNELIFTVSD